MKNVKCSSKGQIGMIEMIMVLVVIMVIIVIGMVFYFKFSISSMEQLGAKISEDRAAVMMLTIIKLPELECTYLGSRTSKSCIDTIKLLALSTKDKKENIHYTEHRRHYSNLLGYMTITFEQLYPETDLEECTPQIFAKPSYPDNSCGKWVIYDNPKKGVDPEFRTMPITLYYPSTGVYAFGQMKIYFY